MDKYIGKRLDGRYEILEMIGSGGMANVYRAHDRLENVDVAVKILREEFLGNEDFVRRFKNESKAISLLSHPNIVKVFDVNFSDSVQCIVMELIDGITLKDYIDRQGQLGWRDAVHFTEQILTALQHAHDRGIVHRDIKPQNIMLLADGSIKVMDFGIARFSRSETRTITDKAIGSVHYISPEQAKGDTTDAKADIYSTGVMLYEMLAGRLPFESDSPVSVAIKQISDTPQSLREIDDTIPEALEEITFKAMAKDPAKRYQSAAQMLRDIDEFKRNPSIKFAYKYLPDDAPTRYVEAAKSTKPQPPAPKSRKAKKRRSVFVIVALSLTFACVIGSAILIYMVFNINGVFGKTEDVILPDFKQQNINDVQGNKDYKFKFEIIEEFDEEFGPGVIISQTPAENMKVKSTGTVKLTVSKGKQIVTIPQVKGLTMQEAIKKLQEQKLIVTLELKADDSVSPGLAYRTSPEMGEKVEAGSKITLYMNPKPGSGSSSTYMPNVVGTSMNDAMTILAINRIKARFEKVQDAAPKGTVIKQSVAPETLIAFNTEVILTVSDGPGFKPFAWNASLPYSVNNDLRYTVTVSLNGNEVHSQVISAGPVSLPINLDISEDSAVVVNINGRKIYEVHIKYEDMSSSLVFDGSSSFQMSKPSTPTVNKSDLNAKISAANGLLGDSGIHVQENGDGLSPGDRWWTAATKSALSAAVTAGQGVAGNNNATQAEVDAAASAIAGPMAELHTVPTP